MAADLTFPSPQLLFGAAMAGVTFLAVATGTGVVRAWLVRRDVLDRPNQRSSHAAPTPRGGGIAVTGAVLAAVLASWLWLRVPADIVAGVLAPMAGLAVVSWVDDIRGLGALPRLAAQLAAVAVGLWTLPGPWHGAGGVPSWALLVFLGLAWVWFINLFNFMDGIDGIAGAETLVIGAGIVALAATGVAAVGGATAFAALAAAAAALGFLLWNWHPARIFLGDVGSVPVGFLLGWLLLHLALTGLWAAALLLPLYYLVDATVTLLRRLLRGAKVWEAHREHFYQLAVRSGRSHAAVAGAVLVAGVALIALAWLAARGWPGPALAGAAAVVAGLLAWMRRPVN